MVSELTGFTLSRAIPDSAMLGVLSGAYKVCGGVIRDNSGQIVAHLVSSGNPLTYANPLNLATPILQGVNTYQLSRIGADLSQVLSLAKGSMILSGLTLSACSAGFIFLNMKIKRVDERLKELAKDVKKIGEFLELQERGRLITALKTLREINLGIEDGLREKLLINAKQTLSEIHEKYRESLIRAKTIDEVLPIEEYYTVTALGHALCAAELDMGSHAAKDISESYDVWRKCFERISKEIVVRDHPERFMEPRYVEDLKAEEIIEWLDFTHQSDKGIEWINDLRGKPSWIPKLPHFQSRLDRTEKLEIEVMRKALSREKVLLGYLSQYRYYEEIRQRPSRVQGYLENLPKEETVEDCFIFVENRHLQED